MSVRPVIVVTHAAFDDARRHPMDELREQLQLHSDGIDYYVVRDEVRAGSLHTWRRAMVLGLSSAPQASHVVWLPDDALLCAGFGQALRAAIAARPDEVFDCYANHWAAPKLVGRSAWYTTSEGYVGLGGTMPRALLEEHLAWRDTHIKPGAVVNNDEGVNLWAMATGRLIWKTVESLVDHDDRVPSIDGNATDAWRRASTFARNAPAIDWTTEPIHLARSYERNHWSLISKVTPPMPRRAYELERDVARLPREWLDAP